MTPKANEFDREMMKLEAEIKRLEAEYTMFFNGRLPRLPWETRARVEKLVKQYDRMNLSNTAQKFRFNTIQSRFVAFCELWERGLKAREEGPRGPAGKRPAGGPGSPAAAGTPANPPALPATPGPETRNPDAIAAAPRAPAASHGQSAPKGPIQLPPSTEPLTIRDPQYDSERIALLYERLSHARKEAGEPPLPYDRFATVIKAQVAKLGGGEADVAFRITVSDGKVSMTAKRDED